MKPTPSAGPYMLRCGKTFYIGSTTHLYRRKHAHKTELKHNHHNNPKLQAAYNECQSFEFIPLGFLKIQPDESRESFRTRLRNAEQEYLDTYKGDSNLANQSTNAHGPCSNVKRYFSPEARERIGERQRGKKLSAEHRAKLSEAKKGAGNPHARAIIVTHPDGTETSYPTGTAAARFFNVTQQCFDRWMKGLDKWPHPHSREKNRWIMHYSARFA